jgi:hypothetical protein
MQGENLLDFEVLGSFLFLHCDFSALCIMFQANVQGHLLLSTKKLEFDLATEQIAHWAPALLHRGLATIGSP